MNDPLLHQIRQHATSKLDNQRHAAAVLLSLDDLLREQSGGATTEPTPAAYFALLLTLLEQNTQDVNILTAVLYLLGIFLPKLSTAVHRAKFADISKMLLWSFETNAGSAPMMKSTIACLEASLSAQDSAAWHKLSASGSLSTPIELFQRVLSMACTDPRPKVRKRAQESVQFILSHPPPPARVHPAAGLTSEALRRAILQAVNSSDNPLGSVMWLLGLVRMCASAFSAGQIAVLAEILLALPRSAAKAKERDHVAGSVLEVFMAMFQVSNGKQEEEDELEKIDPDKLREILQALIEQAPTSASAGGQDAKHVALWVSVFGEGCIALSRSLAANKAEERALAFNQALAKTIFSYLGYATSETVRKAAEAAATGIIAAYIKRSELNQRCWHEAISQLSDMFTSQGLGLRFRDGWVQVLGVLTALFDAVGSVSTLLLSECVSALGEMRLDEGFSGRAAVDRALSAAISAMGPRDFLAILPLNIDIAPGPTRGGHGRAFLLPILKDSIVNTELEYFISDLLPLSERLTARSNECQNLRKELEAKVYSTLAQQVWNLLPGFLTLPVDFVKAFTDVFAERLRVLLESEPESRHTICAAFVAFVEEFQTILGPNGVEITDDALMLEYGIDRAHITETVAHFAKYARGFLGTLTNVFCSTPSRSRDYLLSCIRAFLSITSEQDINTTFMHMHSILKTCLQDSTAVPNGPDGSPASHAIMDIAIGMCDFLNSSSLAELYQTSLVLITTETDGTIQKKAYKALSRILDCQRGQELVTVHGFDALERGLLDGQAHSAVAAKKERLSALKKAVQLLPDSDLSMVVLLVSEAVLGTKEVNERARNMAFELLVCMAERMHKGGQIVQSKVFGAGGHTGTAPASLNEFFTMICAGMAGTTPHMVSASITTLSRLLFEYRTILPLELVNQMLETTLMLVNGSNREVVKSALGFVKVAVVALPSETLRIHLPQMVVGVVRWSSEHKGHFKAKARHIIERLVRKFGLETIDEFVPESDKKLTANLRKRQQRSERRRREQAQAGSDGEADADERAPRKLKTNERHRNAFEDALYGSESDISDVSDDDRTMMTSTTRKTTKTAKGGKRPSIMHIVSEDEDAPMDLLDRRSAAKLTASVPSRAQLRLKKTAFESTDDGKIIVKDSSDEDTAMNGKRATIADDHYRDSIRSKDAYTRVGNRVKFDTRRRALNGSDAEMEDADSNQAQTQAQAQAPIKMRQKRASNIGGEYQAKSAKGDVKKAGRLDPYAYIPLDPSSLKKRGGKKTMVSGVVRRNHK